MMRGLMVGLLLSTFALAGCSRGKAPQKPGDRKPDSAKPVDALSGEKQKPKEFEPLTTVLKPELADVPPDYVLTGEALDAEFMKHGKETGKKYQGKVLEITGYFSTAGSSLFALFSNRQGTQGGCVCFLSGEQSRRIHRLSKGQSVKVLGRSVSKSFGNMELDVISVTELEPSKLVEMTAEDFAKEFEKDRTGACDKFARAEDVILSGRIKELPQDGDPVLRTMIFGTPSVSIEVHRADFMVDWKDEKQVEIRATFLASPTPNVVQVSGYLIKPK